MTCLINKSPSTLCPIHKTEKITTVKLVAFLVLLSVAVSYLLVRAIRAVVVDETEVSTVQCQLITFLPSARILVSGKKVVHPADGRMGVTLSFPEHCAKTITLSFMRFGTYLGFVP